MRKYPEDFINKIICGDCLEVIKEMPENSIDAIVTDPPYGLEFMGKEWDKLNIPKHGARIRSHEEYRKFGGYKDVPDAYVAGKSMQLWHTQWLTEAYRVLKPGGSMLVMGGTRTFHRLMVAIEDSGFIIKDTLMWIYGSGFPKAQDLGKMIDKRMGANRERKPNPLAKKQTGQAAGKGLAGERNPNLYITESSTDLAKHWDGFKVGGIKPAYEPIVWAVKPPEGSYIDNVLKWGVGAVNVDECRVGTEPSPSIERRKHKAPSKSIGSTGWTTPPRPPSYNEQKPGEAKGRFPANIILDEEAGRVMDEQSGVLVSKWGVSNKRKVKGSINMVGKFVNINTDSPKGDSGGASRFFYCAKASRSERGKDNTHPTVKPTSLFMWLIQLVTREEQIILDPFIGSGTTMLTSQGCNRRCIGVEKDSDYCKIAEERLAQGVL